VSPTSSAFARSSRCDRASVVPARKPARGCNSFHTCQRLTTTFSAPCRLHRPFASNKANQASSRRIAVGLPACCVGGVQGVWCDLRGEGSPGSHKSYDYPPQSGLSRKSPPVGSVRRIPLPSQLSLLQMASKPEWRRQPYLRLLVLVLLVASRITAASEAPSLFRSPEVRLMNGGASYNRVPEAWCGTRSLGRMPTWWPIGWSRRCW
jgi:hypothetical protein